MISIFSRFHPLKPSFVGKGGSDKLSQFISIETDVCIFPYFWVEHRPVYLWTFTSRKKANSNT